MRDFDRVLNEKGREDAFRLGQEMSKQGLIPGSVLCSPAKRASETWALVAQSLPEISVKYDGDLYNGDVTVYLNRIIGISNDPLLIVGHNPMIEDIAHGLASNGGNGAEIALDPGYPAGALTIFDLLEKDGKPDPANAKLEAFLAPGRF